MSAAAETASGHRESVSVRERLRARTWGIVVWATMGVWSILLFAVVRDAYGSFRVGRFDLGNMVQAVSNTANGRFLEVTEAATGEQMSRLGSHVDPFLALLAPVWIIWPSPLALGLAQIVVVALGALPVFWLTRRHTGSEHVAGVLALGYLAYPWIATSAAASIHPVTFAITFLLCCIWFLDSDRLVPFTVFALLAMSTGELMGLPVMGLGIWYALARGKRAAGAGIAVLGLAWTFVAIYIVVPAAAGRDSGFYGFYDHVGGSPQGVVRTLLTDPLMVLGALVEAHDLVYLVWLGLPLLFLFLLSPALAAVAIPQLLANGLSDFRSMTDPRYHSVAAVIPFLIAGTVLGIAKLPESRRQLAAVSVLVCSATIALVIAPWARVLGLTPLGGRESVAPARVAALERAVALIPPDARVTTSNITGAHLAARQYLYAVPTVESAEWAVVDIADPWVVSVGSPILTNEPELVRAFAESLEASASWTKVFSDEGVAVFRKEP